MSRGHDAFRTATDGQSAAKIAKALVDAGGRKVTREAVRRWRQGLSTPGDDVRPAIATVYKIAPPDWDAAELAAATDAPAATPPPGGQNSRLDTPRAGGMTLDDVEELLEDVRKKRKAATASAASSYASTEMRLLTLKAQLRGDLQKSITEAAILRHPAWLRLQVAIVGALAPWPDAQAAVGEALAALD